MGHTEIISRAWCFSWMARWLWQLGFALAQGYFEAGLYDESALVLERVLVLEPDHPTAKGFLERARAAGGG